MRKLEGVEDFNSGVIDQEVVKKLSDIIMTSPSPAIDPIQVKKIVSVITDHGGVTRDEWFNGVLMLRQGGRSADKCTSSYIDMIVADSLIGFLDLIEPEAVGANTALLSIKNSVEEILEKRPKIQLD